VIPLAAATTFTGVAGLGDPRRLGRLGGATLFYFFATTDMLRTAVNVTGHMATSVVVERIAAVDEGSGE